MICETPDRTLYEVVCPEITESWILEKQTTFAIFNFNFYEKALWHDLLISRQLRIPKVGAIF
jgi:hypothetical protein